MVGQTLKQLHTLHFWVLRYTSLLAKITLVFLGV